MENQPRGRLQKEILPTLLVFLAAVVLAALAFQKELNINGDNADYISYGVSLAKGEGFRLASHPDLPKSDQYPILFPLFLALVIKLFGLKIMALKGAMVLVFATGCTAVFLLASRLLSGRFLLAAVLLTLTNFWLLDNASICMSENFFMLVTVAGFFFLLRHETTGALSSLIPAMLLLTLTVFVRTIGVAAFAALLSYLALRRDWRKIAWALGCFVILYVANKAQMEPRNNYLTDLFLMNPYDRSLGSVTAGGFFGRLWENMTFYLGYVIQMTLFSFSGELLQKDSTAVVALSVLFGLLVLFCPLSRLRESRFSLALRLYLLFFFAILFVWPRVWSGERFVVPVIPVLYLVALENASLLTARLLKEPVRNKLAGILVFLSMVWALFNFTAIMKKVREPLTQDWKDFYGMAEWAGTNIREEAVFCSRKPSLFYLKSGKQCVQVPSQPEPSLALLYLQDRRVQYVAVDRFKWSGATQRYLEPLLYRYPERFRLLRRIGKEGAAIYGLQ